MGTIGIYDSDFMEYGQVVPNLECAKLCAYHKQKNEIAILAPTLEPDRYTKFFIRKEYDDGNYPPALFRENVSYGGRAFSPTKYIPLDEKIEQTIPDFSIYEKYINLYGTTNTAQWQFRRMLNSINLRIAPNGTDIDEKLVEYCYDNVASDTRGIILHDYFPGKINNLFDVISELSNSRQTKKGKPKPLAIGNKYPIDIYTSEDLLKWSSVYPMTGVFFFRFHGLIDNEALVEMIQRNPTFCRQIYYMIDEGCTSEEDFLVSRAPKIYKQILFCRMSNTKILLKYTDGFFKTPELKNFITLLNCYAAQKWQPNFLAGSQTLYKYCSQRLQRLYKDVLARANAINQDDMREIFQYIRIHNYELFSMFYEWDKVYFEGGEFKNEWSRNQKTN